MHFSRISVHTRSSSNSRNSVVIVRKLFFLSFSPFKSLIYVLNFICRTVRLCSNFSVTLSVTRRACKRPKRLTGRLSGRS